MIVEMRTYRTKPGMRETFLEIFRTKSIPEHAALGMPIIGPFVSIEDPDRDAPLRQIANPIRLSATPATYRTAPPRLG